MARVSIVLPVYNSAATLVRCLESLGRQTYGDFEVVAVDDGSTDDSLQVLGAWSSRLPMRIVTQRNAGAGAARNVALGMVTGEFVYMMDADDFIHPRTLELAVDAADSATADFVLLGYEEVDAADADRAYERLATASTDVAFEMLPKPALRYYEDKLGSPMICLFFFRRSSLAGMRFPEGIIYEDNVFVYEYLSRMVQGVRLPIGLYGYVQEPLSVMHATGSERKLRSMDVVMRELVRRLPEEDWDWLRRNRYQMVVKNMWRDGARTGLLRELTRGWFRDGVIRYADFPWRWRVRFKWYFRSAVRQKDVSAGF